MQVPKRGETVDVGRFHRIAIGDSKSSSDHSPDLPDRSAIMMPPSLGTIGSLAPGAVKIGPPQGRSRLGGDRATHAWTGQTRRSCATLGI